MAKQLKILFFVFIVSVGGGAGLWLFDRSKAQYASERLSTDIPAWEVVPAVADGGNARITNEQQKFSAEAPDGWNAIMLNSNTGAIVKDDFPDCKITVNLGSNDGYLSANALVDQLNPYGSKPQEKHRFAQMTTVGGWPAAMVTIFDLVEAKEREVDVPRGSILFIANMRVRGVVQDENVVAHPRLAECDKAFDDFLASFVIGG